MKKLILILLSTAAISFQANAHVFFVGANSNGVEKSNDVDKAETEIIDFGSAANFIIFTGAGAVANTGISTFTGNVGSHAGAIAGFGAPSVLDGTIESANLVTAQAKIDLAAACVQIQNIPATITNHGGIFGSIAGETIFPGVYAIPAAVAIQGTLILDAQGDPDAMFIIKITGALTSVAGAKVILANGALANNVYWLAVGAVALGAKTTMIGTAIGFPGAVSLGAGGSLVGRFYSTAGAIAIDAIGASIPVPVTPSYNYLGEYTSNGTPLYLETPSDVVSTATQETISNSLPNNYPVPDYNPHYISSGYDTDIKVEEDTDVWVTFVSEASDYKNAIGYYTYDLKNPPTTAPTKEEVTIVFPNASAFGSGGSLKTGDKVNIGSFKSGTGIGWVLLPDAWSSEEQGINDGLDELYSNPNFNPESEKNLRTHNVLLNDATNERIILGFEDIRRDDVSVDNDFKDAIFYLTANRSASMNRNNMADVTAVNYVTSAYDGGLESNGDLADLVAKRNFKREKEGNSLNRKETQNLFKKNNYRSTSNTTSLIDFLPETGMYNTEVARVSSPEDLLGITNAKEVLSVDYYQEEKRVSAVLATITEGSIYDHSKVICDRLNNSSLEDIRTVETRNHKIISSKIKRASGEIEYTLSFSIKMDANKNELFSFWNIDQYPAGNYQNYQIWGSSFSQVFSIANFIIDEHTIKNGLESTQVENVLPNVFVKSGTYSNGVINLNIVNKTNEKSVNFTGNIAETEVSEHVEVTNSFSLSGDYNEVLAIETGVLFDIGFSLQVNNSDQKDALYLADGPWGLDYLKEYATVNNFDVNTSDIGYSEDVYEVDRNASASGEVKGNINLFRHLLPGDQTLDVSEYGFINFKITNNEPVEIIIMQDDDRAWENRIKYTVLANLEETEYKISFNDFADLEGNSIEISNIKTIVFSIVVKGTNYKPYNIAINKLSFSKQNVLAVDDFSILEEPKLINYPNPFTSNTTIKLPITSETVQIQVFDLLGRTVDFQKMTTDRTLKTVNYNAPNLNRGIYKYLIRDDKNKSHSGTFMIK